MANRQIQAADRDGNLVPLTLTARCIRSNVYESGRAWFATVDGYGLTPSGVHHPTSEDALSALESRVRRIEAIRQRRAA